MSLMQVFMDAPGTVEFQELMKEQGRREGLERGKAEGLREAISMSLGARFSEIESQVPEDLKTVQDVPLVAQLNRLAATCSDVTSYMFEFSRLCQAPRT